MVGTIHPEYPTLMRHALAGDEPAAFQLVDQLTDKDTSPEDILLHLIAPVQVTIGELWARNRLSVAEEHVASYINERLTVACTAVERPPERPGRLVVACPDGEWHTLPSRLLTETLRLRGFSVSFLGASVPAAHLTSYLQQHEPAAVLLSISLPLRLPSARRSAMAARQAGVPVLCGGLGFGGTARWAQRIGADAWAGDAVEAAAVLEHWPPPQAAHAGLDHLADEEYDRLIKETPDLVKGALFALERRFRPMRSYSGRQRDATLEDLDHIAAFLAAAVYIDDEALFAQFVAWLADVLAVRHVPLASVDLVVEHLQEKLDHRTRTARMLAAGRTVIRSRL
jgi:methanogenic corrinoid protein MtbC1